MRPHGLMSFEACQNTCPEGIMLGAKQLLCKYAACLQVVARTQCVARSWRKQCFCSNVEPALYISGHDFKRF